MVRDDEGDRVARDVARGGGRKRTGEGGEVLAPDVAKHGARDPGAQGTGEPPGEAEVLTPGEAGPDGVVTEAELTAAAEEPLVGHTHGHAVSPLGDLHDVPGREGPDPGDAVEAGAHALTLVAVEVDALRVAHPLHVTVDVAQLLPDLMGRMGENRLDLYGGHGTPPYGS